MPVAVTSIYAALCGLLVIVLAKRVTDFRQSTKVGVGDGGDPAFNIAIRAHANAVEYIPISLILLLVAELNGLGPMWLHLAGAMIFGSRAAHAYGFTVSGGKYHPARFWGIAFNWLAIVALSATGLVMPLLH